MTIIGWVLTLGGFFVLGVAVTAYVWQDSHQLTDQEHIDWERWE